MRKILKWLGVAVVVIGMAIGGATWLLRDSPPANQSITLPDGTIWNYVGVTVGSSHSIEVGSLHQMVGHFPNRVKDPIYKVIGSPPIFAALLPTMSSHTGVTNLTIWLEGPTRSRRTVFPALPIRLAYQELYDRQNDGHQTSTVLLSSTNQLTGISFPAWPRRSDMIELVAYSNSTSSEGNVLGSIRVKNPARVKAAATWQPDPLGTVRTNGNLMVTLVDFASGLGKLRGLTQYAESGRIALTFDQRHYAESPRAGFQIHIDHPNSSLEDWQIRNVEIRDETGNAVRPNQTSIFPGLCHFLPEVWPYEPVWKLRFQLKLKGSVPAENATRLTGIPLPPINATNHIHQTSEINGVKVLFKELIRRAPLPEDRRSWAPSELSAAVFELGSDVPADEFTLSSITAQPMGLDVTMNRRERAMDSTGSERAFYMRNVPTNATHLDFEFAPPRQRTFEFYVSPNWITNEYVLGAGKAP